jgi:glycosyltransferase involved in cell wall biosynthesis
MKRIVLVTGGQPSTNPRMIKEYLALKKAGYNVKVLYAFWADWASKTDDELFRSGSIDKSDFILVGGSPSFQPLKYFCSRVLFKLFRILTFKFSLAFFEPWSSNRPGYFLEKAAKRTEADLYIAHTLVALPAVVKTAKSKKVLCGFDAEDYHRGEFSELKGKVFENTCKLEDTYMPKCDYITAASPLIADRYQKAVNVNDIIVVNNVFNLWQAPPFDPEKGNEEEMQLFWFSQTIGSNRGLESIIAALEILKRHKIRLLLIGKSTPEFRNALVNPLTQKSMVQFMDPVTPEDIFKLAADAHIGFAAEEPHCENRDICLTNKLFTYLLAGNCIAASNTSAQEKFLNDNPGIGFLYNVNDSKELAEQLTRLYQNRKLLNQYRIAARELAVSTFNWEQESNKFIGVVKKLIPAY